MSDTDTYTIQVNFTYTGSGNPTWNFNPDKCKVKEKTSTIQWVLNAQNGSGNPLSGASLTNVGFKASNNPSWPGTTPQLQSDGSWTCTDTDTVVGNYLYCVTVQYGGQSWNGDPEVDNEVP